jgi:hypothetical protein
MSHAHAKIRTLVRKIFLINVSGTSTNAKTRIALTMSHAHAKIRTLVRRIFLINVSGTSTNAKIMKKYMRPLFRKI